MSKQRIVILLDENGDAEIRSPQDMTDDEVLDILALAVDVTADKIQAAEKKTATVDDGLEETLAQFPKKSYMN